MLAFLNFFKSPKNWAIILFVIILLLVGLFFWQKSRTDHFKNMYETELQEKIRIKNNYEASQDIIRTYIDKNGALTSEILAFQFKIDELDSLNQKYFSLYIKEKNKEPKVIIQTEYVVVNTIKAKTEVTDSTITYYDSTVYNEGNWTIVQGKIPYTLSTHIKKGSTTEYAYNNAILYAYNLQTRGMKNAKVVAYSKDSIIPMGEVPQDTNAFFRVYLTENEKDIRKEIATTIGIEKDLIDITYDKGIYTFYAGIFIPNKDVEPILNPGDILLFPKLWTGYNELKTQDVMTLMTSIYKDKKTNKLMIQVKTNHPGVTFTNIRGADILSTDKKVSRGVRKEFGIGVNIGIGAMLTPVSDSWTLKYGPQISIGLNWTPRWAQFGPSSKTLFNE